MTLLYHTYFSVGGGARAPPWHRAWLALRGNMLFYMVNIKYVIAIGIAFILLCIDECYYFIFLFFKSLKVNAINYPFNWMIVRRFLNEIGNTFTGIDHRWMTYYNNYTLDKKIKRKYL